MSWKALLVGCCACAGLTGTLAAVAAGPLLAEDPPAVPGQPYSAVAEIKSTTVFADGNRIVRTNTVRSFRDGQGRTRVERSMAEIDGSGAQPNTSVTLTDPVKSERVILNSVSKTAIVYKTQSGGPAPVLGAISPAEIAPFGLLGLRMGLGATSMTEAAADTTSLGEKVVNGVLAAGTRLVRTIPSGVLGNEKPITSTLDRWVSTDLGITVQITDTSSIGGTTTLNLQQIVRGEPEAALFTVPADYKRQELTLPVRAAELSSSTAVFTAVKKP